MYLDISLDMHKNQKKPVKDLEQSLLNWLTITSKRVTSKFPGRGGIELLGIANRIFKEKKEV